MTAVQRQAAQRGIEAAWAELDAPLAAGPAAFSWEHPDGGLRAAAYGEAVRLEGPPAALLPELEAVQWPRGAPQPPGPWFGAMAFDGARPMGALWDGFGASRWTLPALLCWSREGRHHAAAFGAGSEERLARARRARALPRGAGAAGAAAGASPRARVAAPAGERQRWDALISRALAAIAAGELDKVVVARALHVEAGAAIEPAQVLAALAARHPSCRTFLLRGDGGAFFLGATPETLCRIEGRDLRTEALAGSARPGDGAALLLRPKELREHRWVVEHIVRGLSGVAAEVQHGPAPQVRELANVAHLVTPIHARLAAGRSVADVVAALHPTPAVAGVSTAAALRFLARHEPLGRGLYAGLVGWIGPGRAELAVALRSALVRGSSAQLFAGAGIVKGSTAEGEWAETALKARALLDALGAAP